MFVDLNVEMSFVGIMIVFSSYVGIFLERGHLLMVLIFLEATMLGLFSLLLFNYFWSFSNLYLCLVLISFGACEAAVGLALLVSLIRSHGNDFVSTLSVYEC